MSTWDWPNDPFFDRRDILMSSRLRDKFEDKQLIIVTGDNLKTRDCIGYLKSRGDRFATVQLLGRAEIVDNAGKSYQPHVNFSSGDRRYIDCKPLAELQYKYCNITTLNISLMDFDAVMSCLKKAESIYLKEEDMMAEKKPLVGYKSVAVVTMGSNPYYYAVYDEEVEAGSIVQVTGTASGQNLTVTSVMDADDYNESYKITEEVCAVVDTTKYQARVEKRMQAAELMKKMDAEIARIDEVDKYARYAKISPSIQALFDQLKELGV